MAKTEAQKKAEKAYRARRRAAGTRPFTVWLLPQEIEALKAYHERTGRSMNMGLQEGALALLNMYPESILAKANCTFE